MENNIFEMSAEISHLALALSLAQGEIDNPFTSATNPHFRSKYVPLHGGLDAIKKPLSKHKIAVIQQTYVENNFLYLRSMLVHESGQWIASTWPVMNYPAKQQEIGSALTYARRYSLFSLIGIAGDPDDDAEASKHVPVAPPVREAPKRPKATEKEPFDEDESAAKLSSYLVELEQIGSMDELRKWASARREDKARMSKTDSEDLSVAYKVRETFLVGA